MNHYIKIDTKQGSQQYEKYMFMVSYTQNAAVTNSDNLCFLMTTGRQVLNCHMLILASCACFSMRLGIAELSKQHLQL